MLTTEKKTIGTYVGWADSSLVHFCVACGRKTSITGNSFYIHLSIDGTILERNYQGPESQGAWPVGSECAKAFDSKAIWKFEN